MMLATTRSLARKAMASAAVAAPASLCAPAAVAVSACRSSVPLPAVAALSAFYPPPPQHSLSRGFSTVPTDYGSSEGEAVKDDKDDDDGATPDDALATDTGVPPPPPAAPIVEDKEELKKNLKPSEIVESLNAHIVGQHDAKRAVAIAMRNRWRRRQLADDLRKEVTPRNVLLVGPTGYVVCFSHLESYKSIKSVCPILIL